MKNPKITITPEPIDQYMHYLSIAALATLFVLPLLYWNQLPERLPIHFGPDGTPDGFGDRASIWVLPVIGLGLYFLLTAIASIPESHNYHVKITSENAEAQYRNSIRLLGSIRMLILLLWVHIVWNIIQVGLGKSSGLATLFTILFIVAIFAVIGHSLWRSRQLR